MSTESMIDGFEHDFEISAEVGERIIVLVNQDRLKGRLRGSAESGVTDERILERFGIACAALVQLSPRLQRTGDARRGVAHAHLVRLERTFQNMVVHIDRLQQSIGDDTYSQMPPGALSALTAAAGVRPVDVKNPDLSFADFLPDPLNWQNRASQVAVMGEWAQQMLPLLTKAKGTFDAPGKSRGSAPRIAGGEVLQLLCLLDRSETGEVRRPTRQHLKAWLELLFEITGEKQPKSLDVLARHVLADQFPKDRSEWRHPTPPWLQTPRELLVCSIDADSNRHWRGAVIDRLGQEKIEP